MTNEILVIRTNVEVMVVVEAEVEKKEVARMVVKKEEKDSGGNGGRTDGFGRVGSGDNKGYTVRRGGG